MDNTIKNQFLKPKNPYLPPSVLLLPLSIMLMGQIFAKMSGNYIASGGSIINIYSLLSYICLICRGFIWIIIIRRMRLVFAYPVMSLNYILVLLVSHLIFNEEIVSTNLIGAGLIGLGVILIGLGEKYNRRAA
ncbi:MAG: hypothetical protein U9N32_07335 [Spirochaetota bacterium]|nr:hypothetical protein [Spirochaetota bacterium]